MQETQLQFLGWEDPLKKEMATRSSILAWEISWTGEPGGLQSMGSQKSQTRLSDYNMLLLLSHFSHIWLFVTPWATAYQVPLSMEFSRQEYWSGLPLPSPIQQHDASSKQFGGSTLPFHSEWFTIVYHGQKLRSGVSICHFLHSGPYSTVREPQWRFYQLQSLLCTQEPWK